jgi:Flp pilus assembly protein TadG
MTITITLTTAGTDTGPFNLFSDVDGYTTAFVSGVSKSALVAGYTTTLAPVGTTIVRVQSTGLCSNYIDIILVLPTTTTTTSTCPTYYQLAGCDPEDNAFTLTVPTLGIGQQYVLPGSPVKYYTYTGASITSCIAPGTYNGSILQTLNIGCP